MEIAIFPMPLEITLDIGVDKLTFLVAQLGVHLVHHDLIAVPSEVGLPDESLAEPEELKLV
jgi:hypothetical protein